MKEPDQKKTILLVDDAPANIQVANSILKTSTKFALQPAAQHWNSKSMPPPDLILLDVMMPEMDGYEFVRVEENLQTRDIPVIFLPDKLRSRMDRASKLVQWITFGSLFSTIVKARVQTIWCFTEYGNARITCRRFKRNWKLHGRSAVHPSAGMDRGLDIAARCIPMPPLQVISTTSLWTTARQHILQMCRDTECPPPSLRQC